MFLIKRPFFWRDRLPKAQRAQRYGNTNKKEEFCEQAICA
jgi:hypothetical protein